MRHVRTRLALFLFLLLATLTTFGSHPSAQGVMPVPVQQFLDNSGNPLASGSLYTYAAGTTTPQNTYTDSTLGTPNANPVVLDAAGRATVYLSGAAYKFVLKNSSGTTIWTQDTVTATAPYNLATIGGKVTYSAATVLTLSSNTVTPTQNVHALDTSGGAQNLNTINTTNVSAGFILYLTANNGGANPVTVKTGTGNITLAGGDYTLDSASKWVTVMLKGSTWYELARSGVSSITNNSINNFRLSLTSGTCVTSADVTAATTVYWTPCTGNVVALYDGTSWNLRTTTELSIAVPATASTVYDVWVYDNAGTPTLELTAWTNDTTRATSLTTQNGVLVKSAATTRRYVATFRTTATVGQTEDSFAKRYVWNYYNRVRRPMRAPLEATATWTYTTATLRQANASTANQLDCVVGVAEVAVDVTVMAAAQNTTTGVTVNASVGEDSTTTALTGTHMQFATMSAVNLPINLTARLLRYPAVGRHFYVWLEYSSAVGTTTWYGIAFGVQMGIQGTIEG